MLLLRVVSPCFLARFTRSTLLTSELARPGPGEGPSQKVSTGTAPRPPSDPIPPPVIAQHGPNPGGFPLVFPGLRPKVSTGTAPPPPGPIGPVPPPVIAQPGPNPGGFPQVFPGLKQKVSTSTASRPPPGPVIAQPGPGSTPLPVIAGHGPNPDGSKAKTKNFFTKTTS